MKIDTDVLIIGGGITGLTVAHALRASGLKITLVEPGGIGGVIRTEVTDGYVRECGPNVLVNKPDIVGLIADLGLSEKVRYPVIFPYRQLVWHEKGILPIPKTPFAFLSSPLVSLLDKLRFVSALFRRCFIEALGVNPSVQDLACRYLGSSG
ncbi:MAG: NAD(P)-binding protein, partial [Bdellovibrionales bacterium]|nr:NAD(P)-binding protein [Bdellovibrionales bacterium]